MGMTIADNIDFLKEIKKFFEGIANNPSINETVKVYFTIESLESAIEIMRKYEKVQQILKDIPYGGDATVRRIQEVVEDGNDDY